MTDSHPQRTPRERADFYLAKAAESNRLMRESDYRDTVWHLLCARSYRNQADAIMLVGANGGR